MENASDKWIEKLREAILREFPPETYDGAITPCDDRLDEAEVDEDGELRELYDGLHGKKWTDIQPDFFKYQSNGYLLLTDAAFRSFLAAWLTQSLENMNGENEVRELLIYSARLARCRILNTKQLLVLRWIMVEFAERDPRPDLREDAFSAVRELERLG